MLDTNEATTLNETSNNPKLFRLSQIVGRKATANCEAIPAIIPVSKSTWWAGVKSGHFPQPVRISSRCVAWRASDIAALAQGDKP